MNEDDKNSGKRGANTGGTPSLWLPGGQDGGLHGAEGARAKREHGDEVPVVFHGKAAEPVLRQVARHVVVADRAPVLVHDGVERMDIHQFAVLEVAPRDLEHVEESRAVNPAKLE